MTEEISKRDEIIHLAYDMFGEHGFLETGVDKLLADSGVSKRTLYRYFRSKEALIAAAITYYKDKTLAQLAQELKRRAKDARGQLLALFDLKQEELSHGDYGGCFAINARLVYAGEHPEIKQAYAEFLSGVRGFIERLCTDAGCRQPKSSATKIMVLFVGTIVAGQSEPDPAIARAAKDMVQLLLAEI